MSEKWLTLKMAHPTSPQEPLEAPEAQLNKFDFVYADCAAAVAGVATGPEHLAAAKNNSCAAAVAGAEPTDGKTIKQCCFRQYYSAMTNIVDTHIGQVVDALKAHKMWDNLLLVLSAGALLQALKRLRWELLLTPLPS